MNGWVRIEADSFENIPIIYEMTGSAGHSFWGKLGFRLVDRHPHPKLQNRIDFAEAQILWGDPEDIIAPAFSITEERFALIGSHLGKIWTCVFTIRGENVRIISVRRARHGEKESYYHR